MARQATIAVIASALIAVGWLAGMSQSSAPEFELIVNAAIGETNVECVSGCELKWIERGINPNSVAMKTFTFKCAGPGTEACSSGRVGGWLSR